MKHIKGHETAAIGHPVRNSTGCLFLCRKKYLIIKLSLFSNDISLLFIILSCYNDDRKKEGDMKMRLISFVFGAVGVTIMVALLLAVLGVMFGLSIAGSILHGLFWFF